jgi:hypothetical protein
MQTESLPLVIFSTLYQLEILVSIFLQIPHFDIECDTSNFGHDIGTLVGTVEQLSALNGFKTCLISTIYKKSLPFPKIGL